MKLKTFTKSKKDLLFEYIKIFKKQINESPHHTDEGKELINEIFDEYVEMKTHKFNTGRKKKFANDKERWQHHNNLRKQKAD